MSCSVERQVEASGLGEQTAQSIGQHNVQQGQPSARQLQKIQQVQASGLGEQQNINERQQPRQPTAQASGLWRQNEPAQQKPEI